MINDWSLRREDVTACWLFGTLLSGIIYRISWDALVTGMPTWSVAVVVDEYYFPFHRFMDFTIVEFTGTKTTRFVTFIPDKSTERARVCFWMGKGEGPATVEYGTVRSVHIPSPLL